MLEKVLGLFGFGLCHQLPERSFFAGGLQVPVCARDVGIYIGFIVSAAVIGSLGRRRATELPTAPVMLAALVFFLTMVWDGVSSYGGFRTTTNDVRLITGLLSGFALPVVLMPMLNGSLWRGAGGERILSSARQLGIWLLAVPASFAIIRWGMPLLGVVYPVLVVAAILGTFMLVNLALVGMLPPFERRAERGRDLLVPALIALVLACVEIAGSGLLKALVVGAASR